MPNVGLVELEDAETGERVLIDTGSERVRRQYEKAGRVRADGLAEMFRSGGIDHIRLESGRDYVRDLVGFFRMRDRRL